MLSPRRVQPIDMGKLDERMKAKHGSKASYRDDLPSELNTISAVEEQEQYMMVTTEVVTSIN